MKLKATLMLVFLVLVSLDALAGRLITDLYKKVYWLSRMSPQQTSVVINFSVITIIFTSNRNHSYVFRQTGDFLKPCRLF